MKSYLSVLVPLIVIFFTVKGINAQGVQEEHKEALKTIVEKYYDFNLKIFQTNSTIEDIDQIFELFTDDFTYVHPKYGGVYTREDLYNGYVRNHKNGGYDGSVIDIKILNEIVGLNAVVVQKCFVEKEDGKIKDGTPEMTLFEFREGKISRIFEYW